MGEKFKFSSDTRFERQCNFDHRISEIKLHSVRALKRYLNENNLIHSRVMETISKFKRTEFLNMLKFWLTKAKIFGILLENSSKIGIINGI